MRFEVPQFIEIEDKIVGPLTWKQFVYVAGGAGALVVLFLVTPFFIFILLAIPIAALSGFLAFQRVNNRPFSVFLESALTYFTKRKLYLWQKPNEEPIRDRVDQPLPELTPPPARGSGSLASMSRKLDLHTLQK
jgi:hypothetical protein